MLDQLLGRPANQTFVEYLSGPETSVAVLLPGVLSAAILAYAARRIWARSERLIAL